MTRHIVIEGNLTRDPDGGYGKDTGQAYTHLDIAVTDRVRNNQSEWEDGPTTYYRVTAFGKTAENVLNSLTKGNTVIATGQLTVRSYTRTDGTPGTANDIIADHLGAALTHTSVTINPQNHGPDQLTEFPIEAARHPTPINSSAAPTTASVQPARAEDRSPTKTGEIDHSPQPLSQRRR